MAIDSNKKYKAALHALWNDSCSIVEYQEYTKDNKSTGHREVIVLENEPCKLSFGSLHPSNQTESAAAVAQITKLFIDENIIINAGSKIIVSHGGRFFEFCQSGEAGIFTNHQEIPLALFKGYA